MKGNQIKVLFLLFLSVFIFKMGSVNAATATFSRGGSIEKGTFVNKTIGGKKAYCSTHYWPAPIDGAVYEKVTSTNNYSKDSYIAGQIIKIAKNKYSGVDQYVYIQNALTCYFRGKASVNRYKDSRDTSLCNDSKVKSLINTAKKYVGEYQFNEGSKTSKLPKLTISTASQVISTVSSSSASQFNYTSSTIKISGLNKENYGGNRKNYYSSSVPKYTLNISGGVSGSTIELCSSNKCYSNGATDLVDGDYILRIKNGGSKGGKVVVSINGDNKSKYPSTNIWKCKSKCGTSAQVMQTYVPSVDVTRDISATQTFNYSAIGKYSALIEKVDESGNALKNATLKLYIADSSGNKIGNDLCSTNTPGNETSCSATELTEMNNYKEGNQLCYTEEVSPSGYKNIGTKCYPISLKGTGANATKYYEYHKNGDEWKETEILSGGDKVFQNYKTFAKGDNISAVNVFNVKNGKKIYSDVEKIYEYKYVVADKEKVFYTSKALPAESSKVYYHGNKTENEDGSVTYEFSDPIYMINIPKDMTDSSDNTGIETSLVEVEAYKKDGKYIILSSSNDSGGVPVYTEKNPQETLTLVDSYSSTGSKVCYNKNDGVAADSDKYCSEDYYMTQVAVSNGSVHITVLNVLNSVKISKKAITGDEELPGAKLALYTTENGKCTNTLVSKKNSNALGFSYRAYNPIPYVDDDASSNNSSTSSTNDSTGTSGSTSGNDASNDDVAIDDTYNYLDGLQWISSDEPVTISGLAAGTYCLVEKVPAAGYKKATTTTKFTINKDGKIVDSVEGEHTGDKEKDKTLSNVTLIVRNELNKLTISKTDITTSKELPGAVLRICNAVKKDDGSYSAVVSSGETGDVVSDLTNCDTPNLIDGSESSWKSTDKPHEISGLPSGTYALVEITAPNGYTTAETIFFKMTDEGVLTDVNGNVLANNKIVMHDKPINNVKTGDKYIIVVIVIMLSCLGIGGYYYFNKNNNHFNDNDKFRKRKIYFNKLN